MLLYVRGKAIKGGTTMVEKEAKVIDSFTGCLSIFQNVRISNYLNKGRTAEKFHIVQELYEGTFDQLLNKN